MVLELAWRNVLRQRRRTLLTFCIVAVSVAALVWTWAFMDGQNTTMLNVNAGHITGHLQLSRKGFDARPSFDLAFNPIELGTRWKDDPDIVAAAPRLETGVLLASDSNARGVYLMGVEPTHEPKVTSLHEKMVEGRYFKRGDRGGMVLGRSMAELLGVKLGSKVAVLTEGMYGSTGAASYVVQGIFDTGNEVVNRLHVFVSLDDARDLLSTGDEVVKVAVRLTDAALADRQANTMASAVGERFEVLPWRTLLPELAEAVRFHEVVSLVIMAVVFAIASLGIVTTLMMSVRERVPQFGVMLALGTSRGQVFRGIVFEGLITALVGCVAGLAAGAALVLWVAHTGIDLSEHGEGIQSQEGLTNVLYPVFSVGRMLLVAGVVMVVAAAAAVYPAWAAARLVPVRALRGQVGAGGAARVHSREGAARWISLAIAARNLLRTPFRSAVLLVGIVFCLSAALFVDALADGFFARQKENALGLFSGDAQWMNPSFRKDRQASHAFALPDGWEDKVRAMPEVKGISPRVEASAVLMRADKSEQVLVSGIDPAAEASVTFMHQTVKQGAALRVEGDVVLGGRLARRLGARLGDKLVLTVLDASGNFAARPFFVAGLIDLGGAGTHGPDDDLAYVHRAPLQAMLGLGSKVTNVALALRDRERLDDVLPRLRALPPAKGIEAMGWPQVLPGLVSDIELTKPALRMVVVVVYLIAGLIVMNAVLMSTLERTREFGTLRALGASRGTVLRLVTLEAVVLAAIATAAGLALGIALIAWAGRAGIAIDTADTALPGISNIVYPVLSAASLAWPPAVLLGIVLLAALWPAYRASAIAPARALAQH
jgi:putative ABC transport system permease protein